MGKKKEKKKRLAVDYLKAPKEEKPKEKKSKEEKLKKKARKEEKKKKRKKEQEQILTRSTAAEQTVVTETLDSGIAAAQAQDSGIAAAQAQDSGIAAVQAQDSGLTASEVQDSGIAAAQAAAIFRALGDESRMQILKLLEEKELYGMELLQCMNIVQSTLSHHMRILTETGLVSCRREGKKALYSICPEKMAEAADFLKHYRGLVTTEVQKK